MLVCWGWTLSVEAGVTSSGRSELGSPSRCSESSSLGHLPSPTCTDNALGTAGPGLAGRSQSLQVLVSFLGFPFSTLQWGLTPSVCSGLYNGEWRGRAVSPAGPHTFVSLSFILVTTRRQQSCLSTDQLTGSEDEWLVHHHRVSTQGSSELELRVV